jgi:hypothetical protein
MSRIRTNGTLIGTTVQLPDPGNDVALLENFRSYLTDPSTGRTYYVTIPSTPESTITVCAHARDGSPVPGAAGLCAPLGPFGADGQTPSGRALYINYALGLLDEQLWVHFEASPTVRSGMLAGVVALAKDRLAIERVEYVSQDPTFWDGKVLGSLYASRSRSLQSVPDAIYRNSRGFLCFSRRGEGPREFEVFYTDRDYRCREGLDGCKVGLGDYDPRRGQWTTGLYGHVRSFGGADWFGIREGAETAAYNHPGHGSGVIFHIVRLQPGCRYASALQAIVDGLGRPPTPPLKTCTSGYWQPSRGP